MLEYFSYKKIKKHQAEEKAQTHVHSPLLDDEDEHFLNRIVSAEGTPPPLPQRPTWQGDEAGDPTNNASQLVVHDGREDHHSKKDKGKGKENEKPEAKKSSRFSFLHRSGTKKKNSLLPNEKVVSPNEAVREEDDINKILDDLNLSAVNNRAFSVSKESQELVQKFTFILKDLVNGVPTAYDDLVHLLDDSQGTLAKSYDHLPSFLQKLITQLPTKLTGSLAPELLAVATEAQAFTGAEAAGAAAAGGIGGAAKSFLKISTLKDLVTKPGAVAGMLKTIMNALKLRWPAFMGTNVLLSLGLFVLLFVFWYCHKRGKEVRLEREAKVDSNGRIIELDDDLMVEGAGPSRSRSQRDRDREDRRNRSDRSDRDREERREHSSRRDHGDDRSDRGERREHASRRERGDDRSDREERKEHGSRRDHGERREHGHSSSRDYRDRSGASTPSRSYAERRPISSRRRSSEQGRRPKSSEYLEGGNGDRRER